MRRTNAQSTHALEHPSGPSSTGSTSFGFTSQSYASDQSSSTRDARARRRSSALSLSQSSASGRHSRGNSLNADLLEEEGEEDSDVPAIVVRQASIQAEPTQVYPDGASLFAAASVWMRKSMSMPPGTGSSKLAGGVAKGALAPALEIVSNVPTGSSSGSGSVSSSDQEESYDPTVRYSPRPRLPQPRFPLSPPDTPTKESGRALISGPDGSLSDVAGRSRAHNTGTPPNRKMARTYRDRTPTRERSTSPGPALESPVYGSGGGYGTVLTPRADHGRGQMPAALSTGNRSSSDEELQTSLHGNNPTRRGLRRGIASAAIWLGSAGGRKVVGLLELASRGLRQGGDRKRKSSVGTGKKYVDKDEVVGGREYKGKSTRKRNALILGAVLLGYILLFGLPFSGSTSSTRPAESDAIPSASHAPASKVRSKLRGKVQKDQSTRGPDASDSDSHILDGLPADLLTYGRHTIDHRDGTLAVNASLPAAAHPIYQLIKDSREKWDRKVKRQSKTLKQAVVEYRRRNGGMNPPKGFDRWWRFCIENDIPLPDEYDQINNDLRIFRALSPRELAARVERASELDDTFTISVTSGSIRTRAGYDPEIGGADERVSGQVELLENFGINAWLPDFKAVYGIHDTPQGIIEWSHRRDLLERVEDDEYYTGEEELDFMKRGLTHACAPTSLTGQLGETYEDPVLKTNKSFISNPSQTFDLCQHPSYFSIHGITLDKLPHMDKELKAVFSLSKTSLNTDVLGVPVEQFMDNLDYIPWDKRKADRLLWRGSNTGSYASTEFQWRQTQRLRLVGETSPKERGAIDLLPVPHTDAKGTMEEASMKVKKGTVNAMTMDITFAGLPIQCNEEDGTCDEMARDYNFNLEHMTHEEALEYKYILDVDGNSWSARTRRLFAGGSLLFKSTIMPEWWTERAQAWVHYVPINIDYSDMHDALLFFRGDIYGRGGEDALGKEIAQAGVDWANTTWRRVDMAAYVARLYLEWARLLAPSRSGSDFVYHPSMEVVMPE